MTFDRSMYFPPPMVTLSTKQNIVLSSSSPCWQCLGLYILRVVVIDVMWFQQQSQQAAGYKITHPSIYHTHHPIMRSLLRNARERYATMCIFFELVYATNSQAAAAASVATLGFMSALVNVCVYCMSSFQLPEQIKKLTTFYGFGWFVGSVPSCVLFAWLVGRWVSCVLWVWLWFS